MGPAMRLPLLERMFPEMAPVLYDLREHMIQQFNLQTAAEILLLDQALVIYGAGARMAYRAGVIPEVMPAPREGEVAVAPLPPAEAGGGDVARTGKGGRRAERQLLVMSRLNRLFLRYLNAMKRWRTQEIGTAVYNAMLDSLQQ